MSVRDVEAALEDPIEGLPRWTHAKVIKHAGSGLAFPAAVDVKDVQLPAILYGWNRRRGVRRQQGVLTAVAHGHLATPSRIDPGTFPHDALEWFADQHSPRLRLLIVADPKALYRRVDVPLTNIQGTFQTTQNAPVGQSGEKVGGDSSGVSGWAFDEQAGTLVLNYVDPLVFIGTGGDETVDGQSVTFEVGETITGQTTGATAQVAAAPTAVFESLEDIETQVWLWLSYIAPMQKFQDLKVNFLTINPVQDLSTEIKTSIDRYSASLWDVELQFIDNVGLLKRTIETVGITARLKDVDGNTVLEQTNLVPGTMKKNT